MDRATDPGAPVPLFGEDNDGVQVVLDCCPL